jgi:hypothetical protein
LIDATDSIESWRLIYVAGTLLYLLHFIVVLKDERKIHRDPSSKRYFKREKKGKKREIENVSLENEYQCKVPYCQAQIWIMFLETLAEILLDLVYPTKNIG